MAKILVVDDAAFMRITLRKILEKAGHEIEEAVDGADGVEKYKSIKPDVVTMDITMPNKDGIQAAGEIKEFDSNARIIMCTAMGQQTMVRQAVEVGITDFIVKPFSPARLIEKVEEIFEKVEMRKKIIEDKNK